MALVKLGVELVPSLDRLSDVLDEHDPVTQQKLIEVLVARHAMHMVDPYSAQIVLASMFKHIKQIMESPK